MTRSLGCYPNCPCTPHPASPGATTRPIQATSLFSSEAKQEERRPPPPIASPLHLGTLGLLWHRPLFPQQAKGGRHHPLFRGAHRGGFTCGEGHRRPPPAARTKGYGGCSRGVRGRAAHAGGDHIPHVGGGVGRRHRPQHRNTPSPVRNPRLCLLRRGSSSTTDSTGSAAEARGGPARAGGLVHMQPLPGAPSTTQNPPRHPSPHIHFFTLFF